MLVRIYTKLRLSSLAQTDWDWGTILTVTSCPVTSCPVPSRPLTALLWGGGGGVLDQEGEGGRGWLGGGRNTHRWDFKTWLKLRITRIENLSFEHNYQHDDFDPFFFYLYAFLRKRGKRVPLKRYFIMSFNFSQEIFIFCLGSRLSLSLSIFLLVCSFAPPKLLYQLSSNSKGLFPLWSEVCF